MQCYYRIVLFADVFQFLTRDRLSPGVKDVCVVSGCVIFLCYKINIVRNCKGQLRRGHHGCTVTHSLNEARGETVTVTRSAVEIFSMPRQLDRFTYLICLEAGTSGTDGCLV